MTGLAQEPRIRPAPRGFLHHRTVLLIAFAFAVMADPVSSVAYAVEAALRALKGDLALLLPTMAIVVGIIAIIIVNYHQLVARFPEGGGAAAASGRAFGEAWAFLPIGALVVDFVLTISISVAAGASAIVAYFPSIAGVRVPLALGLLLFVAGLTWFGHIGRTVFATMTLAFIGVGAAILIDGFGKAQVAVQVPHVYPGRTPLVAVILAFPVAMALATGVEAPSSAIAQLGQLDDRGRRRFGRVTLWLTLAVVGGITLGLTALAVRLGIGLPPQDSTQIAEVARASGGRGLFAAFQATSALLLLAAASSSFQAGPGLLKALARNGDGEGHSVGILASWMGKTNRHHTPYWGVVLYLAVSAAVVIAVGARDQELVLYYAVAVFVSFLAGLVSMARFSQTERRWSSFAMNAIGAVVVGFTLAVNLKRGYPIVSLTASLAIAGGLYHAWAKAGRPRGVAEAEALAEEIVGEELEAPDEPR